jgi:uncharacterized protein
MEKNNLELRGTHRHDIGWSPLDELSDICAAKLLGPRSASEAQKMIDNATRHELLEYIRPRFRLDWRGHHGVAHWGRVETRGLSLCKLTGANPKVVVLFSIFHDSCRENEYTDPLHGTRGARLAEQLHGKLFTATDAEMSLLIDACTRHSDGHLEADITVQTCWDADRLDLPRVGIRPLAKYLCTDAAKKMLRK